MTDDQQLIEASEARAETTTPEIRSGEVHKERREFFKAAFGAAAVTAAGGAALSMATSASAAVIADNNAFVFLLQLDYLAAQYYSYATTGAGLAPSLLTGQTTDTAGAATGARQVTFTDPLIAQYAREFAQDLVANVTYIRAQLGSDGISAQPAIDLGTSPTGAFSKLAQAAAVVGAGASFDPYASDENFLLGAFMFEDVIVTAYIGVIAAVTDKTLMGAASGLLATHAHHASVIRALLYARDVAPSYPLRAKVDAISNVRDNLDGTTSDLDQGISSTMVNTLVLSNVVPAASNGSVLARSTTQVLNILYLNSLVVSAGGFYPAGINGAFKTSGSN